MGVDLLHGPTAAVEGACWGSCRAPRALELSSACIGVSRLQKVSRGGVCVVCVDSVRETGLCFLFTAGAYRRLRPAGRDAQSLQGEAGQCPLCGSGLSQLAARVRAGCYGNALAPSRDQKMAGGTQSRLGVAAPSPQTFA